MTYGQWRDRLLEGIDRQRYTPDWLDHQVASGAMVVMATDKAVILFSVKRYPTGLTELHGELAAGELNEIADVLIPRAEEWALRSGCVATNVESTQGWSRVLKKRGYLVYQTALRRELNSGAQ